MNLKQLLKNQTSISDAIKAKELSGKEDLGLILKNVEKILILKGFSEEDAKSITHDAVLGDIDKYKSN